MKFNKFQTFFSLALSFIDLHPNISKTRNGDTANPLVLSSKASNLLNLRIFTVPQKTNLVEMDHTVMELR